MSEVLVNDNRVIMPGFKLRGQPGFRFSKQQLRNNYRIAANRYVIEVHFSRVALCSLVDDQAPYETFPYLNNAWMWANGLVLFQGALQRPDRSPEALSTLLETYFWATDA